MKKNLMRMICFLFIICVIGLSVPVFAASKKPSRPTLKGVSASNAVAVAWNKAKNAKKYELYVSVNGKKYKKLKVLKGTYYLHKNVKVGNKYAYKVRAVNGNAKSRFSNIKVFKIAPEEPFVPQSSKNPVVKLTNKAGLIIRLIVQGRIAEKPHIFLKISPNCSLGKSVYIECDPTLYDFSIKAEYWEFDGWQFLGAVNKSQVDLSTQDVVGTARGTLFNPKITWEFPFRS